MSFKTKHKIAILIPYFGKWPEWIDLYFDSVERNDSIDFHFITDCDTSISTAKNVFFHNQTFSEYVHHASKCLEMKISISNAYKICDLRPMFGILHYEIIKDYDFYGWTDVDLLFGNIREFYTDDLLAKYDVFSTHANRISGHLAILRNKRNIKEKYKKIYGWKSALLNPKFVGIDEHGITNAFTITIFDKINEKFKLNIDNFLTRLFKKKKLKRLYMQEQFTTPFTPIAWLDGTVNSNQPNTWYYSNGVVTNNRDNRKFMYIHFMNFKSSQWRHDGTKAPWEGKDSIYFLSKEDFKNQIIISDKGLHL